MRAQAVCDHFCPGEHDYGLLCTFCCIRAYVHVTCGQRTDPLCLVLQAVEAPTLAMLVPLLVRGMAERQTAIKRKTAVITDNMAKLVDDPVDAAVFLPRLLPGECVR